MNIRNTVVTTGALIALLAGATAYYHYRAYHPKTDDAYVGMHVANLAAQVSGPVSEVRVRNQQAVKAGDLLVVIDPRPFQLVVDRAEASLQQARDAQAAAQAQVDAANSRLKAARAAYDQASQHGKRIQSLAAKNAVSRDQADTADAALTEARDAIATATAQVAAAVAERGEAGDANAAIKSATASLAQAKLDLAHTRISAPGDGIIGNFDLRPGSFVSAGQSLFALVETHQIWVDANYKETDLHVIQPGQSANVSVDMVPGKTFKGKVESLSPASGNAFSLLPAENATGNWVKVTQRFPVRVMITDPTPGLRVGASAEVTIDATQ